MIPVNYFGVYIVTSQYNVIMGVYQTFEQAIDRVSGLLQTNKLVEKRYHECCIRYLSEANPRSYYDIHRTNFFYDQNRPLVETKGGDTFEEKFEPDPRIVNK